MTSAAFATSPQLVTLVETNVYATTEEVDVLATLPAGTSLTVLERGATHARIQNGEQEGFVRESDVASLQSRYVVSETYTLDDAGERVAYLPYGTQLNVYESDEALVLTTEGTWVARDALADSMPSLTPETRFVKQADAVYMRPEPSEAIRQTVLAETVVVYGNVNGYARVQTGDAYAYIAMNQLGTSPVKTGQRYVQSDAATFTDLGQTVTGSVKSGQLVSVYGTHGAFTRLFTKGQFVYVETKALGTSKPTYKKTGQRYAQVDAPLYGTANRKTSVGSIKRGQLVSVYGTDGAFTRLFTKGQFVYVETSLLGTAKPTYQKTGQRYLTKETPVYERAANSKVVTTFKRGQLVNVYGTEGAYTRVSVNGSFYFVLTNGTSKTKPPLYDATGMRYVKFNGISVYASASTQSRVSRLNRGQVVETFGTSGYYTRVRVGGQYRFVATGYLSLNKPIAKPKAGTVFYVQLDGTPHFSTDVAYARPAGTLKRGTRVIGIRSIDDDFWQVRLPNGKTTYVLNPYISTTQPKAVHHTNVNAGARYMTTKRTPFYANPNDTSPIGYLDTNRRVYPRSKSGDSYLIQYNWRPVYVKLSDIRVSVDPLLAKRNNTQQERFVAAAVNHLGTPYTWGSQSPLNGGFDCSGLVHYAANQAGKVGGRTNVSGYWSSNHFKNKRTAITSGHRGDIIFFAGTYRNGPSHIGIMLDNEFFIHAGGETLQINSIYDPQWRTYFLGYKSL